MTSSKTNLVYKELQKEDVASMPSIIYFPVLQLVIKRIIDIIGAVTLLVVLSPIFVLTAILIKLNSPGPVFHIRERVGYNLSPLMMWKFRTMIRNAEELEPDFRDQGNENGPFFKVRNDPRVTKLGRFFRRYSIDELPQLINVLKGEMSLVGPRPLFDHEVRKFIEPKWYRRFIMKPGLTCIWQVNGRSNTSYEDRMRYDLEYIDNWSLLLDFKLLLKTMPAVLKGDGAV